MTRAPFILSFVICLAACGRQDRPARFHRVINPQGPASAKNLVKGACLRLVDQLKEVGKTTTGLSLHSRGYDLVNVTGSTAPQFVPVVNDAALATRAHHALTGRGAPVQMTAVDLKELKKSAPAAGLLSVATQTDCATVKYASGEEFKVIGGNATTILLFSQKLNEFRTYANTGHALTIDVVAPALFKNCDGSENTAKFERIGYRLAWDESAGLARLNSEYATIIGLNTPPPAEAPVVKNELRRRARPTAGFDKADVAIPLFTLNSIVNDLPARAAKSECVK